MQKYDLVISLGSVCPVADALKRLKITEKTYPFDWSDCDGDASEKLLKKCNLIKNHFENAFIFEDFSEGFSINQNMRGVINKKTGVHYGHYFPWNKSMKDFFPEFVEKCQRRIKRLYDDVEKATNILFIYQDMTKALPLAAAKEAINILKQVFPQKNINLLVFLPVLQEKNTGPQEIKSNVDNLFVIMHSACNEYSEWLSFLMDTIRRFLNINYYSFSNDRNIISYMLGDIESFGRWSISDIVFFRLQTNSKQEKVSVNMNVVPFVNEFRKTQKCKIWCNRHEIKEMIFDTPNKQELTMVVPNDNDGNLDFIFEFDNPVSPKDLGVSADVRRLALGFIDATISNE